jgi:hypothetical protein
MGFGSVIGFIGLLQLKPTSKDNANAVPHTLCTTTGHTRYSQSVSVFTSRYPVVAFNCEHSPFSGFPNYPRASATSFSQQQLTTTETQLSSNPQTELLNCHAYNISTRIVQKIRFLCCSAIVVIVCISVT